MDLAYEHDVRVIEEVAEKYGELMDWFNKDFPEGSIRLEVNSDQRNGTLNYKLSVYSGKEMADNVRFLQNTIHINKQRFEDIHWMDRFKKSILPMYKSQIVTEMNKHFRIEREKNE